MKKWEQFIEDLSKFGMKGGFKPGLKRIEELLRRLGSPHNSFPAVHIGGTNGKGSTSAFLAQILQEFGCKVGLYTSPHLENFRERIQINRSLISDRDLDNLIAEIEPVFLEVKEMEELGRPSYFEVATAAAFLHFARQQVDVAVVEVGLGGRLDATNVISPLAAVITSIGLEHTAILGSTISQIAREKAGIIKKGVPVVTGAEQAEAQGVIEMVARDNHAPLYRLGREILLQVDSSGLEGSRFSVEFQGKKFDQLEIALLGEHQTRNASLALTAFEVVRQDLGLGDYDPMMLIEKIKKGLKEAWWPGRMEVVDENPRVILDGAHNRHGIKELARFIKRNRDSFDKLYLVFGVLGDKDARRMLEVIHQEVECLILTKNQYFRARDPEEVAREVSGLFARVEIIPVEEEAVKRALKLAGPGDLVCITGSLYTVGEIRKIFV